MRTQAAISPQPGVASQRRKASVQLLHAHSAQLSPPAQTTQFACHSPSATFSRHCPSVPAAEAMPELEFAVMPPLPLGALPPLALEAPDVPPVPAASSPLPAEAFEPAPPVLPPIPLEEEPALAAGLCPSLAPD